MGTGDDSTLLFSGSFAGMGVMQRSLTVTTTSHNQKMTATDDGLGHILGSPLPITLELFGTGTGLLFSFSHTMAKIQIVPGSVTLTDGFETFTDTGSNVLNGSLGGIGTINYITGQTNVTFANVVAVGANITTNYSYYQMYGTVDYITSDWTLQCSPGWAPNIGAQILANYSYTVGSGPVGFTTPQSSTGAFIPIPNKFKLITQVYPATDTTWIWKDHPLWTLLGLTIMDNMTADLVMLSSTFQMYRLYIGTDFRWSFVKSDDSRSMGKLLLVNLPFQVTRICVVGAKRILETEDIKSDHILDWVLYYAKALVKITEGNTLRKSSIINVTNDGESLVTEGKDEVKAMQEKLMQEGRWMAMSGRF